MVEYNGVDDGDSDIGKLLSKVKKSQKLEKSMQKS